MHRHAVYTWIYIHNICLSRQTFILATSLSISLCLSLSLSTMLSLLLNNFIPLVIGSATATTRAKALSGLVKEPTTTTTRTTTTCCIERQLSRSVLLGIGQARSVCRGSKRCQVASRMKSENNFYYYCCPPSLSVMCSMCPSLSLCRCNASFLLSFRPFSPTAPRRRVVCLPFPSLATLP